MQLYLAADAQSIRWSPRRICAARQSAGASFASAQATPGHRAPSSTGGNFDQLQPGRLDVVASVGRSPRRSARRAAGVTSQAGDQNRVASSVAANKIRQARRLGSAWSRHRTSQMRQHWPWHAWGVGQKPWRFQLSHPRTTCRESSLQNSPISSGCDGGMATHPARSWGIRLSAIHGLNEGQ